MAVSIDLPAAGAFAVVRVPFLARYSRRQTCHETSLDFAARVNNCNVQHTMPAWRMGN
jgi:hypothetical protein